jgi:hypothetical protein
MKIKNVFYGLISVIVLVVSMLSCTEQTVKVKSLNYADRCFLVPTDTAKGALSISIQVEMPDTYADPRVLNAIRNTLISNMFGKEYLNIPVDSILAKYYSSLAEDFRNSNEFVVETFTQKNVRISIDYLNSLEGFTLLNNPSIYSYGFNRNTYYGGAHGIENSNYLNFDLKDGHVMDEKDLFAENYAPQLIDLLKKGIAEQSDNKDLEQSPYWTDSIKPNGNFFVSDEGITYVFNPYEIAPYYVGKTEVSLPYADIAPLLKQGSPIAGFVNKGTKEE